METLWQDIRYGVRMLVRNRTVTAVALMALALGIGACTAIFSAVYGVLIRPLPYRNPEQVMLVLQVNSTGGRMQISDPNFEDLKSQNQSLQSLAQFSSRTASVSGGNEPARARVGVVSREFFEVLRVQPVVGRTFLPEELKEGASPAVLVSYAYWRRHLGGDPDLFGKRLTFFNRVNSVVGVLPQGFSYPAESELWVPREQFPRYPSRTAHNWQAVGRLADGVPLERARAELGAIARRLKQQYGDDTWMTDAAVVPLQEAIAGPVRLRLLVLMGAVGFLLLVACANVTNLLLAQAASRQKELAVRTALGAGRGRLVRQFLAESLVLSLLGGGLGIVVALWGMDALLSFEPGKIPRLEEVGINRFVLGFALGISLLSALALGLITALQATREDVQERLKESQRTHVGGASRHRLRHALVASQIAITMILLVGAGLLGHSFLRLLAIDPGFRVEGGIVVDLSHTAPQNDQQRAHMAEFYEELYARLRGIPGVEQVGGVNAFPLSGGGADGTFLIMGNEEVRNFEQFERLMHNPERTGYARFRIASEGYFGAMQIPLLRGRLFDRRDGPDAPHVAVISESLERQRWPHEDAIGKRIQFGNMDGDLRLFTVVGIVGDIRELGVDSEPRPTFYSHSRQRPNFSSFSVVMTGKAAPGALVSNARRILRELDPQMPPRFRTLEEIFSASLADRRFSLLLLGVFAGAALLLAAMGVYGVTSYAVAQRTQEIGIRMALGARTGDVLRLVVSQCLRQVLLGLVLGVLGASWLTRLMSTLLFDVKPTDPAAFATGAGVLACAALLACYLPARRATRVDPMSALRYE